MASRRSSPTRSACWRKSGVVSITTLWPPREISREGRSLLSCGSLDLHTRQGHPSVGTPMEVPEPRTVTFSGAGDMVKALEAISARCRVRPPGVATDGPSPWLGRPRGRSPAAQCAGRRTRQGPWRRCSQACGRGSRRLGDAWAFRLEAEQPLFLPLRAARLELSPPPAWLPALLLQRLPCAIRLRR